MSRVLIVSSDPAERRRAGSALALRQDVDVVEVDGGAAAADLLRTGDFDVLVVDGDIDAKGGFSWLYELRAQCELRDAHRPPAVVLVSRDEDRFLAEWAGAAAMVFKPADGFAVADRVAELAAGT